MSEKDPLKDPLKEQRDRFLAFAFASADLFIEVSEEGRIAFAAGAAKGVTGIDDEKLLKRNWLDLFSAYEQSKMQRMRDMAKPGGRIGPILVTLSEQITKKQAALTAIKMPGNGKFYITLGVSNDFVAMIAPLLSVPGSAFINDADKYADAARDALFNAKLWQMPAEMTFMDFVNGEDLKDRFGADGWGKVQDEIGAIMANYSFGGNAAGQIADGRYSFVHDPAMNLDELKEKIIAVTKAHDPDGKGVEISHKTVESNLQDIEKREIDRAVAQTVDQFKDSGMTMDYKDLKSGYASYISENEMKIKDLRSSIDRVSFSQFFQPVVKIATRELVHYEILARFEKGETRDWIRLGEDSGLASDLDMAVAERAMNHIKFKAGTTRTKFSMNISPKSLDDPKFPERLKELIAKYKGIPERLSFEITESSSIENHEKIGKLVKDLRAMGFKVALDDFAPAVSCLHLLQNIKVDTIKIDNRYIGKIMNSERDAALIRNLVTVCADLKIEIIAEGVETQEQADALAAMGIQFAQGHLYSEAKPRTEYIG